MAQKTAAVAGESICSYFAGPGSHMSEKALSEKCPHRFWFVFWREQAFAFTNRCWRERDFTPGIGGWHSPSG
jgi:hypothetical protein